MIRELTALADLRAAASSVGRLWRQSPRATIFSSPEWIGAWWSWFGNGRLRAWIDDGDDGATAFAPLFVRDGWNGAPELALVGLGNSDYLDAPSSDAAALSALIDAAVEACARDGVSAVEWSRLDPASTLAAAPPPDGWACRLQDAEPCVALPLPASNGAFDAGLRGMIARNLRRGFDAAAARGTVRFEHATGERVASVLEDLFALHGERWRARGMPGVLSDARVQRFHHTVAREADRAGMLRLIRLTIGGETAGVIYGFTTPAGACLYISGFNPACAACSPGTLLIRELIRRAIDDGAREIDFLSGREPYKYHWGGRDRRLLLCRLRRPPARRLTPASRDVPHLRASSERTQPPAAARARTA